MGRFWIELSPVSEEAKCWPAKIPEINRMVVPLLLQSSICSGFLSPRKPLPRTVTTWPRFSISTPMLRKQAMVDRQSVP